MDVFGWSLVLMLGMAAQQEAARGPDKPAQPAAPPAATAAAPSLFPAGYLDHAGLTQALRQLAARSPGLVRMTPLARSAQGREVWLMTLGRTEKPAAAEARRPAVLIVANLEADHVVGSQVALAMMERITRDPAWLKRLETCQVFVVPRLNPDGAERLLHAPRADLRTNLRPLDRDRDGKAGEDGPDDLNGDGLIVRMRVKDGKATLIPDPSDPRLLRKADAAKGERPVYSEYAEGLDNDGDGLVNEDPPGGVNLNRNWPYRWTEFDPESGPVPVGEPETRALVQFAFDHPEIAAVWCFGLQDNLTTPPRKPGSTIDDADLPIYAELARLHGKGDRKADAPAEAAKTAKPAAATPAATAPTPAAAPATATATAGTTTDGSLVEWAYHDFGVLALASRLWNGPEARAPAAAAAAATTTAAPAAPAPGAAAATAAPRAAPAAPAPAPAEDEARWLHWNDRTMGGRAFLPFAPFKHATLGDVEIGGWRPGVRLNPPFEQVDSLAGSSQAFLAELVARLPRLAIRGVKVEPRGGRIFEVTARVENEGVLPTALAQGVRSRKAAPVRIRAEAAGARLLGGPRRVLIDALGGAGGQRELRWLVRADVPQPAGPAPKLTIHASSPKAGDVRQEIPLGQVPPRAPAG